MTDAQHWGDPHDDGRGQPKSAEVLAQNLRSRIVRGELKPGDTLPPEARLIATSGASRPVVREALRLLENERLIRVVRGPRGGSVVCEPTSDVSATNLATLLQFRGASLADVYSARVLLEAPLARLIVEEGPPDAASRLQALLDEAAAHVDDPARYTELDQVFHLEVARLAGNESMRALVEMFYWIIERANQRFVSSHVADPDYELLGVRRAHRAHTRLVEIIALAQADEAETFWARHVRGVGEVLLERPGATHVVDLLT